MKPLGTWKIVGILSFLFPKPGYMPSTAGHPYDQSSGKSPAHMHISMAIWTWNQIPGTPWHYHDSAEVKTLCTVKPGFALTIHSPRGTGFLMTYLDLWSLSSHYSISVGPTAKCKLMNPEYRCVLLPEWAKLSQWTTGMDLNLCLWVLFMYFN